MRNRRLMTLLIVASLMGLVDASPVSAATSTVAIADVLAADAISSTGAVDAAGHVHIVLTRYEQPGLWYATDASGSVAMTKISSVEGYARAAIAVDGSGKVHVAIGNEGATAPGIWYLSNRSGTWRKVQLLDQAYDRGPAIAVDALGEAHVTVAEVDGSQSNYFTNRRGYWLGRRLGACLTAASIALDSANHPHIACVRSNDGIFHTTDTSGAWVAERVTTGWHQNPIISTGAGGLRIAFERVSPIGIFMSTRTSTGWGSPVKVASAWTLAGFAVGPAGHAHASVASGSPETEMYLTNSSGSWVARRAPVGSVSIDGNGGAHVVERLLPGAHFNASTTGWIRTIFGSSGYNTTHPRLAIDSVGVSRVVYWLPYDVNPGIYYAYFSAGAWHPARIRAGDGQDPDIAVTPAGKSHIAYVAAGRTEIWYGTNTTGSWAWTNLATATEYSCPSIAVAASGHVFIATRRTIINNGFITYVPVLITNRTGPWVSQDLPYLTDPGCPSIAVDGADKAYVAYEAPGPVWVTDRTGSWVQTSYGMGGDTNPAIGVDGAGKVVLTFTRSGNYDSSSVGLYLRTDQAGAWTETRISRLADAAMETSLAVRADGKVAVAFNGFIWAPNLFVTSNRTGVWRTTELVSGVSAAVDLGFAPDGTFRVVSLVSGAAGAQLDE
jgi:hypothetical protein